MTPDMRQWILEPDRTSDERVRKLWAAWMANAGAKTTNGLEGPWFDQAETAYSQRAAALSNKPDLLAAASEYREKGYLVRDFGFSESDLAEAAAYTKAITTGRIQDAWLVNNSIRNLATHPRVIEFLNELYQAEA